MKTARRKKAATSASSAELVELRVRLAEAEETLRAIRTGEADAVVITQDNGLQVFTLEGAEHAYRVLIESMNEGALTLAADKTILYANQCFARMIKCPLEQVIGSSFRRLLSVADRSLLKPLLKQSGKSGAKIQVQLNAADGSHLPVQISIQVLAKDSSHETTFGMVVTDMSEARRSEELMRALNHRVVQVQETERASVALELHDHITQPLIAVLFRCQAMVDALAARGGAAWQEAVALRAALGETAEEGERISRNLRPGVLDQLGLDAVVRSTCREFGEQTGVAVRVSCAPFDDRLPADIELALYRILQEALRNVEKHAGASQVIVELTKVEQAAQLRVRDDGRGLGFDVELRRAAKIAERGLGLLSMRERAAFVGGTLTAKSFRRGGTEILAQIPLPAAPQKAASAA